MDLRLRLFLNEETNVWVCPYQEDIENLVEYQNGDVNDIYFVSIFLTNSVSLTYSSQNRGWVLNLKV